MPTVLREGPYEVYFTNHDVAEPPHVHVDRDDKAAKFWLKPVRVGYSFGFSARELRVIERLVREHEQECLRKWNEHFGT